MAVSLVKGQNLSLDKVEPGLKQVLVGLGWNARSTDGADFDLDASVFMLKTDRKVRTDQDFIFYHNLRSPDGSVTHTGDVRSGSGGGDDEVIEVDLQRLPSDVSSLVFTVTIYDADVRRQNFGMVSNAYIRIANNERGTEIARFDLSEEASVETAMIFGEIYRQNSEWKFKAVGQGYKGGLAALARSFGINV